VQVFAGNLRDLLLAALPHCALCDSATTTCPGIVVAVKRGRLRDCRWPTSPGTLGETAR
jgi:hypothetical protein